MLRQILLVILLAQASLGCVSWSRGSIARYTDPSAPVLDVNRFLEERSAVTHFGVLKNGKPFRVLSTPSVRFDAAEVQKRYDAYIESIEKISGEKFPRGVELVIVPQAQTPANFRFTYTPSDTYRDLVFLPESSVDATAAVLCEIEPMAPHEMWHVVGHVWLDQSGSTGAGWFEEGLAEYVHWRLSSPECHAGPDRGAALRALLEKDRRAALWTYSPFLAGQPLRKPIEGSGDASAVARSWLEVDAGYRAALGVFFVMEDRLGAPRLEALARRLNRDFRFQSDKFYEALNGDLGFDIRLIDDAMVERVLSEAGER